MPKRKGLRKPAATMRRAFSSGPLSGLPGQALPVSGSILIVVPLRPVGSVSVRTSWARSAPPSSGGSPQGLRRTAELADVGGAEAGAVAAAGVEGAFGAELQVADRVRGELLAPVLDQDILERRSGKVLAGVVAFGGQLDQAATDQAGVGAFEFGAGIAARFRAAPAGCRRWVAEDVVVGVEDVDVGAPAGEFGVEGKAEDPAVAGVVGLGAQVGKQLRTSVPRPGVDQDPPGLLGDEDSAVGREAERRRFAQTGDHRFVLKAAGQCGAERRGSPKDGQAKDCRHQAGHHSLPHQNRLSARSSGAIVKPAESSCCQ